jgi:hypothetical protein
MLALLLAHLGVYDLDLDRRGSFLVILSRVYPFLIMRCSLKTNISIFLNLVLRPSPEHIVLNLS